MGGFPKPKTTIALNGIPLPARRERQKNSKLAPLRDALKIERWFAIPSIFNCGAAPLLEPSDKPGHFLARWHQMWHCEFEIASEHNTYFLANINKEPYTPNLVFDDPPLSSIGRRLSLPYETTWHFA